MMWWSAPGKPLLNPNAVRLREEELELFVFQFNKHIN